MRKPRLSAVATLLWLLTCCLLPADCQTSTEQPCMAPTAHTQDPGIILQAQKLEYFETENRLEAAGKVSVVYGDTLLLADRLEMNTESGVGIATGDVRLSTPEDQLWASRVDFDLTSERGLVLRRQRPHRQHVSHQQRASGTPRTAALCGTARSAHDVHRAGSRLGVSRPAGPPRRGQLRDPAAPVLSHQGRAGVLPAVRRLSAPGRAHHRLSAAAPGQRQQPWVHGQRRIFSGS